MNVLIVDDVDVNRVILSEMLQSAGYETVIAEDGLHALGLLATENIDLVISDLIMPNMDGLRLCAQVRKLKQTQYVPFIIYTGTLTTPDDEELAKEFGADAFLRKPVAVDTILATLQQVMEHRGNIPSALLPSSHNLEQTGEYSVSLIQKLEKRNLELESLVKKQNEELIATFDKLQRLYTLLPICPNCKKSRIDEKHWAKVRSFIEDLPGGQFTNGVCDECGRKFR